MTSRVTELIVPLLRAADSAAREIEARPPGERGLYAHAADAIEALDHECQLSMATIDAERQRAETAEANLAKAREALNLAASALGTIVEPAQITGSTVVASYAQCVAAQTACRSILKEISP